VQLTAGRSDLAEADLRTAIAAEPRHVQATKALAVIRFRMGDREEARRLLERVLELSPGDPDATEGLAALRRGAS
jgi:Flp pilus assembly protein TadD